MTLSKVTLRKTLLIIVEKVMLTTKIIDGVTGVPYLKSKPWYFKQRRSRRLYVTKKRIQKHQTR